MAGIIGKIFKVRPGEWGKVGVLGTHLLSGTATLILSRTLINALFLEAYDPSYLPYVYAVQASFFVGLSTVYSWFAGKSSRRRLTSYFFLIFLGSIILWRLALISQEKFLIFILYVWMEAWTLLLMLHCWLAINDSFDSRQGKRLFPVVLAAGTLGAVVGGIIARGLVQIIGTENLLVCCIPFAAITMIAARYTIVRYISGQLGSVPSPRQIEPGTVIAHFRRILLMTFGNRLLVVLLVIFVATNVAATMLDFQFKISLKENLTKNEIAAFLGAFYALASPCTLIVLLLFTNRLLISLGIAFGLATIPLIVFAGSIIFIIFPVFWVIVGTKFLEEVARFSLRKASWELAYVPFSPDIKRSVNIAFNGIFGPSCVLFASVVLILCHRVLSIRELAVPVASFCVLGAVACICFKKPYTKKLKESLNSRKIRLQDTPELGNLMDRRAKDLIERSLMSTDKNSILFSLQLIRDYKVMVDSGKVEMLYKNEDPEIRAAAVRTIGLSDDKKRIAEISSLLCIEKDPEVKKECIRALGCLVAEDAGTIARRYMDDPEPMIRAECIISLITKGSSDDVVVGEEALNRLFSSHEKGDLIIAAYIAGEIGGKIYGSFLKKLLVTDNFDVRAEAIRAVGKIHSDEYLPQLVDCLKNRNVAHLARESLSHFPSNVIPFLLEAFEKETKNVFFRIQVVKTLGSYDCRDSVAALVKLTVSPSIQLKDHAIRALNRLNRRKLTDLSTFRENILTGLRAELRIGYELYALLGLLDRATGTDFLKAEIRHRIIQIEERLFRLLALIYDQPTIYKSFLNFMGCRTKQKANVIELLYAILEKSLSTKLLPFLEDIPLYEKLKKGGEEPEIKISKDIDWLEVIMNGEDEWFKHVATWCANEQVKRRFPDAFKRRKKMMPILEKIFFLKGVSLFSGLSGETLQQIAATLLEVSFNRGEVIFSEGDPGDCFYLILRGKLKLTRAGKEVAIFEAKDCFGEIALIDYAPRTGTMTVVENCDLLRLDKEDFLDLVEEYAEIARGIMQILSQRFRAGVVGATDIDQCAVGGVKM
jgi:hypothetical protein